MGIFNNREGMYSFSYKPIGLGKLSVYDRKPLIFILDISGGILLGLNIHWIPRNQRQAFIDNVEEIMGKTVIKANGKRERIKLIYTLLKERRFKNGMQAVRKYYLNHCSAIQEVAKTKWNQVLGIPRYDSDKRLKSNNYQKSNTK